MDNSLQRLLDETAIRNIQIRYCHGIDRGDWSLVRSCYHADATDDHGEFSGGIEEFLAYCRRGIRRFVSTSHFICNQLIELDGDTARVEAYVLASHRLPACDDAEEKEWICNSRFFDLMERRNGEWRIARRRTVIDSDYMVPAGESWAHLFQGPGEQDVPPAPA